MDYSNINGVVNFNGWRANPSVPIELAVDTNNVEINGFAFNLIQNTRNDDVNANLISVTGMTTLGVGLVSSVVNSPLSTGRILLPNASGSSAALNRFKLLEASGILLDPGEAVEFISTVAGWKQRSKVHGKTVSVSGTYTVQPGVEVVIVNTSSGNGNITAPENPVDNQEFIVKQTGSLPLLRVINVLSDLLINGLSGVTLTVLSESMRFRFIASLNTWITV